MSSVVGGRIEIKKFMFLFFSLYLFRTLACLERGDEY